MKVTASATDVRKLRIEVDEMQPRHFDEAGEPLEMPTTMLTITIGDDSIQLYVRSTIEYVQRELDAALSASIRNVKVERNTWQARRRILKKEARR